MDGKRHITWENFSANYIEPGVPAEYRIAGKPSADVFVSSSASKLGLRIEHDGSPAELALPFEQIEFGVTRYGDKYYIEITTESRNLYEAFYAVLLRIADLVQLDTKEPLSATLEAFEELGELLRNRSILSEDSIIGLWGELWFLERLISEIGTKGIAAWQGAKRDVHDYRFRSNEIEIKTTRSEKRKHMINGLTQLEASPGKKLYLVSIQVVPTDPEGGRSLVELVNIIETSLSKDTNGFSTFRKLLGKAKYRKEDERFYIQPYSLRTEPVIIEVDDIFPKITRGILDIGAAHNSQLIDDVHYRVDITGMGDSVYSKIFEDIIKL